MKQNQKKKNVQPYHNIHVGYKSPLSKIQQRYMKNLAEEVHKSTIAVVHLYETQEHISQFRKDEQQLSKNIQQIKNDLHYCVLQINSQQKKQKVFKQLISILKGEMTKMQAKQMEIKEKEQQELDKNIKQLRDDIDKISHKKNQQIAKIAVLKESSNQSRSQRVVYSNLFKKLQRQLKEHQQIYKNELLRAQKNKVELQPSSNLNYSYCMMNNKRPKINKQDQKNSTMSSQLFSNNQRQQFDNYMFQINISGDKIKSKNAYSKLSTQNKNSKACSKQGSKYQSNNNMLSLQIPQNQLCTYKKSSSSSVSNSKSPRVTRLGRINSSTQNMQNYSVVTEQLTKFNDKIKKVTGCSSVAEIKALMDNILFQNKQLQAQINEVNQKIQEIQKDKYKVSEMEYEIKITQDDDLLEENIMFFKDSGNSTFRELKSMKRTVGVGKPRKSVGNFNIRNKKKSIETNCVQYQQLGIKQSNKSNEKQNLNPQIDHSIDYCKNFKQTYARQNQPHQKSTQKNEELKLMQQYRDICQILELQHQQLIIISPSRKAKSRQDDQQDWCHQLQSQQKDQQINYFYESSLQIEEKCKILDTIITHLCYYSHPNRNSTKNEQQHKYLIPKTFRNFNQEDVSQNHIMMNNSYTNSLNNKNKQHQQQETRLKALPQTMMVRRESHGQLSTILNKMEKFGNCEKFLDRQGFCEEYLKQINRKTKTNNKAKKIN